LARWQARLANEARHAIQIDLALRAREEKDYDRVAALLEEMRPEYQGVWETCYVRTLWLRETPLRAALKGHKGPVDSVAFSPDATRLLTGSQDGTARVWDAGTGQQKAVLKGHVDWVSSVAFSPDGKRILTGSLDRTARGWDDETGQAKVTLVGHTAEVTSVAFSPDGTRVLTLSADRTARVWDAKPGQMAFFKERFAAVLRGEDKPADNAERLTFAQIGYDQKKYAFATRLWAEALASDPKLGNERRALHRYNAARAAALATAGPGEEKASLTDKERTRLRQQALIWLRADLALRVIQLEMGKPADRTDVQKTMLNWRKDPDLAGLRDAAALAKLPADEQKAFTRLWADVAALLKKAEEKPK
jgi:hypothetical protein